MTTPDFLYCRKFRGGFLITPESLSTIGPSDPDEAYLKATQDGVVYEAFFTSEVLATMYIHLMYEIWEQNKQAFEYLPEMWYTGVFYETN